MASSSIRIRPATRVDLPSIHDLIRSSYAAMNELTDNKMIDYWAQGAEKSIVSGDLVEETFVQEYLTPDSGAGFWVAEEISPAEGESLQQASRVVGCVGLRRKSLDDADLVRMSVNTSLRGNNIGHLLVSELRQYCLKHNVLRVHLITANTRAASFYTKKCNFLTTHAFTHPIPAIGCTLTVSKMTLFLGERIVRKVALIGGTHGNERIGVELASQLASDPAPSFIPKLSTMEVVGVVGNPEAVRLNRRYVGTDLNRLFASAPVSRPLAAPPATIEHSQAATLLKTLGPKSVSSLSEYDFCIDLHSTNADVGLVCMISGGDYDPLALYVASKLDEKLESDSNYRITTTEGSKAESWSVDSVSNSGLSIEVGPLPHGTISHTLLASTKRVIFDVLETIERRNEYLLSLVRGDGCSDVKVVTEANSAWQPPADSTAFKLQKVYVQLQAVEFPANPSAPANSQPYCVHPSMEGPNFRPLVHGDPLFIATDDSGTVLPFVHPAFQQSDTTADETPSLPPPVYTMFVNEAAYIERNIALAVYEEKVKPVLIVP